MKSNEFTQIKAKCKGMLGVYGVQNHFCCKIDCKDWKKGKEIMERIVSVNQKCVSTMVPMQSLRKR